MQIQSGRTLPLTQNVSSFSFLFQYSSQTSSLCGRNIRYVEGVEYLAVVFLVRPSLPSAHFFFCFAAVGLFSNIFPVRSISLGGWVSS
jgi:hypothetical protein